MMSRRLQNSRIRESTFEHEEHLLGKASQISLQVISPSSEISDFFSQGHLVLLQLHDLFVGFIDGSLQFGVLLFQLAY